MRIEDDVEQILIGEEELAERIRQLGQQITEDYEGKDLIVVGILKGASLFMSDLIRKIEGKISIDFMVVSSYGNASETSGVVRIIKDLDMDITDKHILLVEDIIDTGLTLAYLKEYLCNRKAASVRICTLLDKPCRRSKPVDLRCPTSSSSGMELTMRRNIATCPISPPLKEACMKNSVLTKNSIYAIMI